MPESPTTAGPLQHEKEKSSNDHTLTICAISIVAAILSNTLHEGVGHGLTALLTGAKSGILTTSSVVKCVRLSSGRGGWNTS
jgi:hypothetical protein